MINNKKATFFRPIIFHFFIYLLAIIVVSFNIWNVKIGGSNKVIPSLDLMIIFYSAAIGNIFGLWIVFLLGIWHNALNNNLIGITAFSYIMAIKFFQFIELRIASRENFVQILQLFIAFCCCFFAIKWLLLSIAIKNFYSFQPSLWQIFLSAIFYPIFHRFLNFLNEKINEE